MALQIKVTAKQFGQLEVAWMLCTYPGKRRVSGGALDGWKEAQQHILGFIPEGDWSPVIAEAA